MKLTSCKCLGITTSSVLLLVGVILISFVFPQQTDQVERELFRGINAAMERARQDEVPAFSPTLFAKATEVHRRAEMEYQKGERLAKIRRSIAEAMETLSEAAEAAKITKVALAKVLEARRQVAQYDFIRTRAPEKFREAEKRFWEAIQKAEKGDIPGARGKSQSALESYREATLQAAERGPMKEALAQLEESKETLSRERYTEAARELRSLKSTICNAKNKEYEISTWISEISTKIDGVRDSIRVQEKEAAPVGGAERAVASRRLPYGSLVKEAAPVGGAERAVASSEDSVAQDRSQVEPSKKRLLRPQAEPRKKRVVDERIGDIRPMSVQRSKRPLYGRLVPAEPLSPEEEEFAKAFADQLGHATAVVAANPGASYPAGSLAAKIKEVYLRLDASERTAMQSHARALLSREEYERRRYFGEFATVDAVARHATPGLDAEMRAKLRQAVRARLDARFDEILEFMGAGEPSLLYAPPTFEEAQDTAKGVTILPPPKALYAPTPTFEEAHLEAMELTWTWVEASPSLKGEIQAEGRTEITLFQPEPWDFRWTTSEEGAEQGFWQLVQPIPLWGGGQDPQPASVVLGSGVAGNAPGGIFTIDFAKFLPPKPPEPPAVYHLRVLPRTKMKTKLIPTTASGGVKKEVVPPKAVGPWSAPVIINYKKGPPTQKFEFPEVYRQAWFHLDRLCMVKEQTSSGPEEFHLAGFVQETVATGASTQWRFRYKHVLEAKKPHLTGCLDHEVLKDEWMFHLNNPDQPEWPRAFTVVISLIEKDDGGSIAKWSSKLWEIADEMLSEPMAYEISSHLKNHEKVDQYMEHAGEFAAEVVAALIAAEASSAILGMVTAAAGMVIAAVVAGMDDDYYGTEAAVLVLPTNLTDYIKRLDGHLRDDGSFKLQQERMTFYGYAPYPFASAFDGICEVWVHWELSEQELYH